MADDMRDVNVANQFAAVARSLGWRVLTVDLAGSTVRVLVEHDKVAPGAPAAGS